MIRSLRAFCLATVLLLASCYTLPPAQQYMLRPQIPTQNQRSSNLVLLVDLPESIAYRAGQAIAYVRTPNVVEYFIKSEWALSPIQMLQPLLVETMERSGAFRSVLSAPSAGGGDVLLEAVLMELYQDFTVEPAQARVSIKIQVVNPQQARAFGSKTLSASAPLHEHNVAAGVDATNRALTQVLAQMQQEVVRMVRNP